MSETDIAEKDGATNETQAPDDSGDDLDALLAAFQQEAGETGNDETAPADKPQDFRRKLNETHQYISEERQRRNQEDVQTGIAEAVKSMKESFTDSLGNVPDAALEGMLFREGSNNQKFTTAFLNRASNPDSWQRVVKSFGKKLATNEFKPSDVDGQASQDREAMRAAVRGTTKQQPPPEDEGDRIAKTGSEGEWAAYHRKRFGNPFD